MIKNIDHIAFKVGNLLEMCDTLGAVGLVCNEIKKYSEVGMNIAFLGNAETRIELLEVIDQTSPISSAPEGFNHIGFKVKNIDKTYSMMQKNPQFTPIGNIRQGAHSRIFFFKIKGYDDVLFECVE